VIVRSADSDTEKSRVFIFAGQSNIVGSDSKAKDIQHFPPFVGDWNPDEASGFMLYPLPVQLIPSSIAELDQKKAPCLKAALSLSAESHDRSESIAMLLFWCLQEFRDAMGLINAHSGSWERHPPGISARPATIPRARAAE